MSTLFIIITILKAMVSATGLAVIIYWHVATRGTWRAWPAGRSLMALLAIVVIGYAWRVVNRLVPDYALEEPLLGLLYISFTLALIAIGVTIRRELNRGRARVVIEDSDARAEPIAVVLATTEEKTDGKR